MLLRFDDTNPSKEKMEFEESICKDVELLGITPDAVTHTSEHFQRLYEEAIRLIKKGLAFVDDADKETVSDVTPTHTHSLSL
jgi:glutamyl-tRNA synthetase